MKLLLITIMTVVIILAGFTSYSVFADEESFARQAEQAGNYREALTNYVKALQSVSEGSSKDQELREKIIKLVQKIQPPPAVPEETVKYEGRAETAVRNAKTPEDYLDAAKEYKKALLCAPWVASYYFNLGVVLEKAGKPEEAIRRLQLYLLASPDAQDAREVQKRISGLEYQVEKAAIDAQKLKFPRPSQPTAGEIGRDGRFIAYSNGTVLDTRTNLMWAAKDNGSNINWAGAKSYCENYRGGGYTDWRMPTRDELEGLYDAANTYKSDCGYDVHLTTELIRLTCYFHWASETRAIMGYSAAAFGFGSDDGGGGRYWQPPSSVKHLRVLPVRFGK